MSGGNDVIEWMERAEEDYQLARLSVKRKTPLTYGGTFHAQQCVEKYLKALLVARQAEFPRTHDLAALNTLCQQSGILLPVSDDHLDKLSAFAVEARYPGSQPTIEEAREALEIATSLRRFVRKLIVK